MKVRLIGFAIEVGDGISLTEFINHLIAEGESGRVFQRHERRIYLDTNGHYHVGLVISIRDQQKYCELERQNGKFKLSIRTLGQTNRLADFNLFIINQNTGRGLYQHYHHSFGVRPFGALCNRYYSELKDNRINAAIQDKREATGRPLSDAAKRRIKRQFKGGLKCDVLMRTEALSSLIDELADISAFDFTYQRLLRGDQFTPLNDIAKKRRVRVTLEPTVPFSRKKRAILSTIRDAQLHEGNIVGKDPSDDPRKIKLQRNQDIFGEWEYDDIADEMDVFVDDFASSPLLDEMLSIADENSGYFE